MGIRAAFNMIVVVAALGYFVDIYDLILFGVVRVPSLNSIGITDPEAVKNAGLSLINWQMFGMLFGGVLWGVMGDRKGRVQVLFGSILMYSLANIMNGFVDSFGENSLLMYKILRLVAGIGLAGELGAGITLVSETMHKEDRGYGTMLVVMFGALGGVTAALVGRQFDWHISYFVGGTLGLALLLLRAGAYESGMFREAQYANIERGNFLSLFTNGSRLRKYIACIFIGLPIWFSVGILILLAKEITLKIGVTGIDTKNINGTAILWLYVGLAVGDIASGWLSQVLRSRKKVVLLFIILHAASIITYLSVRDISATTFAIMIFLVGATTGYWGLFATIASEQFGTNLRATVATTVPNFVRGALIPITAAFQYFDVRIGTINAAMTVGMVCIALGIAAVISMDETFGKDLDYTE